MTTGESRLIADQLRRSVEGDAWHGPSLVELVNEVSSEQAAAHPISGAHSIWELVLHIAAWMNAALTRLAGSAIELTGERDWPPVPSPSSESWSQTVDDLRSAESSLRRAVERLEDARLAEITSGKDYSLYFLLHGVVQHNLYHAGQIALLMKVK
ncbi:MAG: DinB family protein [Bryobacteraceae bacterium]